MLIALTGGIAAGKSTVAEVWTQLGAEIIDSDQLARLVVQPGTVGLSELVNKFGASILNPDGTLNRESLGRIVFTDEASRRTVESILHPLIRQLAEERFAKSTSPHLVYAIPLLVEAGSSYKFDRVCAISAPESVRISRLISNRNLTLDEATKRVRSQVSDTARESVADVVIDSNCTLDELRTRAEQAWTTLTAPPQGAAIDSR
jgi:dephospho-CoA kinase